MLIRIRETGEVQTGNQFVQWLKTEGNTSIPDDRLTPEILDAHGADPVQEGPQPTGEAWQRVEPDGVEEVSGQWRTKWKLEPEELDEEGLNAQKALKLAALAAKRWEVETGGISLFGMAIETDEDTQRKITGAYVQADKNPAFSARWKMSAGVFITLDASTLIVIGDAVAAHIQSCFDNESALSDEIMAAADFAELSAIDLNTGWPS